MIHGDESEADAGRSGPLTRALGLLALACFSVRAAVYVFAGRAADALWGCHVATLLVGVGALLGRRRPVAVGVLWLCFGNPIWVLDIATGGDFSPISLLTHVGGLVLGVLSLARLGFPGRAWLHATIGYLALLGLTRLFTPPEANVNLAFAVWPGWERSFPSHVLYLLTLMFAAMATFFVAGLLFRKVLS